VKFEDHYDEMKLRWAELKRGPSASADGSMAPGPGQVQRPAPAHMLFLAGPEPFRSDPKIMAQITLTFHSQDLGPGR
jgi:hypothetical protein